MPRGSLWSPALSLSWRLSHAAAWPAAATAVLLAAPASAVSFQHDPPSGGVEGEDLVVTGSSRVARKIRRARVRYRQIGTERFQKAEMKRKNGKFVARIPGALVREPGVEYFIVLQTKRGQVELGFGSPRAPAVVPVAARKPDPEPARPEPREPDPVEPDPAQPDPGTSDPGPAQPDPQEPAAPGSADPDDPFATERALAPDPDPPAGPEATPDAPRTPESGPSEPETPAPDPLEVGTPSGTGESGGTLHRRGRALPAGPGPQAGAGGAENPFDTGLSVGDTALLDEFAVFAAEDESSVASAYAQRTSQAAAIVSVIGRVRIQQMGARTLMDVLKTVPGLETSSSINGFGRVAVRGLRNDARILLMVDGHRVNNPYDGRGYWRLPAGLIERVEVIRGPGSALYGTGAFAGVVNVVTRRMEGLEVVVRGGSFTTGSIEAAAGGTVGDLSGHLALQLSGTEGPKIAIEEDAFTQSFFGEREEMRTYAQRFSGGATADGEMLLDAVTGAKLTARAQLYGESRGPTIGAYDTVGPSSTLNWTSWNADIGYAQSVTDTVDIDIHGFYDQHVVGQLMQLTPSGYSTPDRNGDGAPESFPDGVQSQLSYTTFTAGLEAKTVVQLMPENRLVAGLATDLSGLPPGGFSLLFNRQTNGAVQPGAQLGTVEGLELAQNGPCAMYGGAVDALGACRLSLGVYVQDEWRVAEPLQLTAGVRLSSFSDVDFDLGTHLTPRAGLVWSVTPELTFKVLAASAFRAPTFEEKYDQSALAFADFSPGAHLGNAALKPELTQTLETGLSWTFSVARLRYRLAGNGFLARVSQAIERVDESGGAQDLNNAGGFESGGLEGEARVEFPGGSYAYFNMSWFRAYWREIDEVQGPGGQITQEAACTVMPWETVGTPCTLITDVPQLRANIGLNVEMGDVGTMHLGVQAGSERRNNFRSELERLRQFRIPPYMLLGVNFRTRPLADLIGLELTLNNMLDVPLVDDVPRPDRVPGLLPRAGVSGMLSLYLNI